MWITFLAIGLIILGGPTRSEAAPLHLQSDEPDGNGTDLRESRLLTRQTIGVLSAWFGLKGTEPDTCYYVANADRVIDHDDIDLNVDPPPDLVVEIESTNESTAKFPIYVALQVPEIWRVDAPHNEVRMYELRGNRYWEVPASVSFPILTPKVLGEFLRERETKGQKAAMAAFRAWLKKQR